MRPIVDLNNLWYSEETLVYYSRLKIIYNSILLIVIFIGCYYTFNDELYLLGVVLLIISFLLIRSNVKFIRECKIVLLRINSEGVSVRDGELISWDGIENERIEIIKLAKGKSEHDFIFYDKKNNRQVKFRVEELNIGVHEIVKSFEIHRVRFNKKNLN